jgi:hypothetical protein
MATAGMDFGSTLAKAYWRADGKEHYASADDSAAVDELSQMMRFDGVKRLRVTGIGAAKASARLAEWFPYVQAAEGAVDDEIRMQALGTRLLMGKAPRKLLIAAIGTGVSYTKVRTSLFGTLKATRHPLGSCHGGGTILGLGRIVGAESFKEIEEAAAKAEPGDLLVKDKLPETAGSPIGELVIAHFHKPNASFEEECASVFNLAACSIIKDLAILTSIPFSPKDIAVVGTVAESATFRRFLGRWAPMLKGCRLHFPAQGGFAAAVGAWADIST